MKEAVRESLIASISNQVFRALRWHASDEVRRAMEERDALSMEESVRRLLPEVLSEEQRADLTKALTAVVKKEGEILMRRMDSMRNDLLSARAGLKQDVAQFAALVEKSREAEILLRRAMTRSGRTE